MNRIALALSALLALSVSTGCASSTVIRSKPSGAVVRNMKGEKLCRTPCTWSGTGTINSTDTFTLEKDGFEETTVSVRKDQVNGLAIAGWVAGAVLSGLPTFGLGLGMLIPIAWMADYPQAYTVELDPAPAPAAPPAVPVSPVSYEANAGQRQR